MESHFINNLIPRLKKFAQNVELKEALVDRVWVIYGDKDQIEYEFERNGEIAVTRNGNSYDGVWKILGSGRLKIKTDFTNNTLEYNFAIPGLLVLKLSGAKNQHFLLFDPNKILNGDLDVYLKKLESDAKKYEKIGNNYAGLNEADKLFLWFILGLIVLIIITISNV